MNQLLLPSLHIKLGLIKQFVKALLKNGTCFMYFYLMFPVLSWAKLKERLFTGFSVRKLISGAEFDVEMNKIELRNLDIIQRSNF